jgi:hypothetical protein
VELLHPENFTYFYISITYVIGALYKTDYENGAELTFAPWSSKLL